MRCVNKTIIVGYVGVAPKVFNGCTILSVGTTEGFKGKDGWQEETEWHQVKCFGRLANQAADMVKGEPVYIEGRYKSSEYQKDGRTVKTKDLYASMINSLKTGEKKPNPQSQPNFQSENEFDEGAYCRDMQMEESAF
jgi:single-strand DNA-binding protein